jgi:hypothetical protein
MRFPEPCGTVFFPYYEIVAAGIWAAARPFDRKAFLQAKQAVFPEIAGKPGDSRTREVIGFQGESNQFPALAGE